MADVKWIKMATDIFDNRKIRQIECLPDGDSIIVIWVKILCLAGTINDSGYIYLTKEIPYTEQMLSAQFNRPVATIKLALNTFEQFGMIEVLDNILRVSNWEKYQNVDKLQELREYNRIAQQRSREKKKLLASVNDMSMTCQPCQGTDIDKIEELEGRIRNNNTHSSTKHAEYGVIVEKFNEICVSLPSVTILSDKRKKAMDKVFIKDSVIRTEDVDHLFLKVEASDFLTGRTGTWKANFDWVMNSTNIAKVLDGNYDNRTASKPAQGYKKATKADELDDFYKMAAEWANDSE